MKTSSEIKEIVSALSKVQGEISSPAKSGKNMHLRCHYATLPDVIKAITSIAPQHGLSFTSGIETREDRHYCITTIYHTSGEFIQDELPLLIDQGRNQMQSLGSAITYARRYSLQNLFGLSGDDDDGEGAAKKQKDKEQEDQELIDLTNEVKDSINCLRQFMTAKDLKQFEEEKLKGNKIDNLISLSKESKKVIVVILKKKLQEFKK